MKKSIHRSGIIAVLLCFVMLFAAGFNTVTAYDEQTKTVKIGYIDYEGFFTPHDDGTVTGYGVDYLNEISKYTGWKYEYVYDTWSNQLEKLKKGEIDFICHAQKTPEREQDYIFSKYSTGSESSILYVRSNDDRYYYNDFDAFNGMRIGMLNGSFQNEGFAQYAAQHNFTYNPLLFKTTEEAFAAMDNGEIDAVAMGSLAGKSGYKIVAKFGSDPFYLMTGKSNTELINTADSAMGQIRAENPYYEAELYKQYYGNTSATSSMLFTRDEAEYIKKAGTITVGLLPHRKPLSYMDDSINPAGMTVDALKLIAKKSGLKFAYKFLEEQQTGYDFINGGSGDIVAGIMESDFSKPNPILLQSDTLLDTSIVFVGKSGMNFNTEDELVVALPSGFIQGEKNVSAKYPSFKFISCASNEDCLKAIRDGRADVMLQNMYVIRESLQSPKYSGLEMFPAYSFEEKMKIVSLNENEKLMSIINKTIKAFSDEEKNNIVIENTIASPYRETVTDMLYKYRIPFIGIAVLLLAIIALCAAFVIQRQRSYNKITQSNKKLSDTNLQLADAVAQADRANTAKSQFLSRMSHEIRTPMNAIVGITAIAKMHENDADKIDDYLRKIESSSRVLLNIINDVLDMSAIESNKLKIAEAEFDMKSVMSGISSIYYTQCKDKGIDFKMAANISDEMLMGDSLRVNQVLLNLVSNAYKFTPKGGEISITVSETEKKGDKVYLRFKVADTGAGMTQEMQQRLFKPFEQESATTAQKHGGSGLGMSIAKNLVDMMHGAIKVQSEKGKGTTFTVDIPFTYSNHIYDGDSKKLNQIRALIVDDDENARDYTTIILRRLGVEYECAEDGEKAMEKLIEASECSRAFDICFVDWKMPKISGVELTRKIREQFDENTIIIIVSAYDLSEVEDEAKLAGANMFIPKPLFQSSVLNLLMQITDGQCVKNTEQKAEYDFKGKQVLLAEDVPLNSEIAIELLKMVNLNAELAENGKIAYEKFINSKDGEYSAILMDIQMPEMDGYEATKEIRKSAHPQAKTIPIIAMTANAFTEDVSAALSAGMNDHVAKPIDTEVLYSTLDKYI